MAHIAVITTSFPGEKPGSEAAGSFVRDFTEELAKHVQVTVLAPGLQEELQDSSHYTVRRFTAPNLPLSLLRPGNVTHWPRILQVLRSGQIALSDIVEHASIDHIFALWALPPGYWAWRMLRTHGVPYSVWVLGSDIWSFAGVPVIRSVLKTVLRNSSRCYADGFELGAEVERLSNVSCHFLPSSRSLGDRIYDEQVSSVPPYRLAFLGRWHANKGIDVLLNALRLLDDSDWKKIESVRIAGGGRLESLVRDLGNALHASHHPVMIEGYKDKEAAIELLTWADYVLIPSRKDSIPVVFSDAMQLSRPVIVAPAGDLSMLVDDYGVGIVSEDSSPQAFAAAIKQATQSQPDSYKDGLKKAASNFALEETAKRVITELLQTSNY
ncbi:MAG: glycosyltransferase family 4 protein [Gammaproteobacteria bacterium]|nr:glycosyltransferase family 4 protein [Gammaproteobacteria bacterium]